MTPSMYVDDMTYAVEAFLESTGSILPIDGGSETECIQHPVLLVDRKVQRSQHGEQCRTPGLDLIFLQLTNVRRIHTGGTGQCILG